MEIKQNEWIDIMIDNFEPNFFNFWWNLSKFLTQAEFVKN